jgi:hypothetical protein
MKHETPHNVAPDAAKIASATSDGFHFAGVFEEIFIRRSIEATKTKLAMRSFNSRPSARAHSSDDIKS